MTWWWTDRVRTLFWVELRSLMRDRRTVVMSIVIPVLLMPIMLFASHYMEQRRDRLLEARVASFAVTGPREAEARALLARALGPPVEHAGDAAVGWLRGVERRVGVAERSLQESAIDFYVVGQDFARAVAEGEKRRRHAGRDAAGTARVARARDQDAGEPALDTGDEEVVPPPDLLALSIFFRSDRDDSRDAARRLVDQLREIRRERRHATLADSAFPVRPTDVAAVSPVSIAGDGVVAGLGLGRWLTALLLFLMIAGGAVVSQDTLAGEKERGTLETLLSTATSRGEIVAGKVLLVLSVALAITAVQVANLLVYVGLGLIPASNDLSAAITPALAAGLLVFVLPLAALVAALLVLISGRAQSYREAQLYLFPLLLLCAVPAAAASLPEISLRSAVVLVPIANISVGVKEMLVGRIDWLMLPIAWLVTAATAGYAMVAAARALSTERLIVPSSTDSAAARVGGVRVGQVATWFAVMWAILLVVSLNLGEGSDIRLQLLINLVVVFLGGSLLFIRRFELDARVVLSLHAPHPLAWVAVLVGTPAALVTGIGVFRLSQLFLPVPREMLESFSQYLVPDSVPFWQLLPMMTILPGICEEIAFRGVLLHALRRHYPAIAAALLVGIVFGLFHFSLFRIFPTAYLGVVLATVTLLAGSLYPAMVWHALNNALGLLAGHYKVNLETLPVAAYVGGAGALSVALWLLWRTRPAGRQEAGSGNR